MFVLILAIHVIICTLLIGIILIQAGRGGGLVDSLSGVESMFGTKTNTFLTRTTTILSILFFMTCLGLEFLSLQQSRSLMKKISPNTPAQAALPVGEAKKEATPEEPKSQSVEPAASEAGSAPAATASKPDSEVPKTE